MKKGCSIAAVVVVGLFLLIGGAAAVHVERLYGLTEASLITHDTVATDETRLRVVVKPDNIADMITRNIPRDLIEKSALPGWVKDRINWLVQESLPNEIALLSNADFKKNVLNLTLFINERRFGPYVAQRLNETKLLQQMKMVTWDTGEWQAPERGVIRAQGQLPLPTGLESLVLDYWVPRIPVEPITITEDHLFEAALDNRSGEGLVLILTIAEIYGVNLDQILQSPDFQRVPPILAQLTDAHLTADTVSDDEVVLHLRVNSIDKPSFEVSAGTLLFLNMMVQPELQRVLREQGLTFTGKAEWKADLPAIVGEYHITGIQALIQRQLGLTPASPGTT